MLSCLNKLRDENSIKELQAKASASVGAFVSLLNSYKFVVSVCVLCGAVVVLCYKHFFYTLTFSLFVF